MKKTAEELKSKIIQQLRFHRISELDEDKTAFFIMNLFEEYRSQASELPSDDEIQSVAVDKASNIKYTWNFDYGVDMAKWMRSIAIASGDARIKELEEDLRLLRLIYQQYSNFYNEVVQIDDKRIKEIDNKHFPF